MLFASKLDLLTCSVNIDFVVVQSHPNGSYIYVFYFVFTKNSVYLCPCFLPVSIPIKYYRRIMVPLTRSFILFNRISNFFPVCFHSEKLTASHKYCYCLAQITYKKKKKRGERKDSNE